MQKKMREIIARYGAEYVLRQLAEECAEVSHAALKLIRARRHETPVREETAREGLVEELADVENMLDGVFFCLLDSQERAKFAEIREIKELRMVDRLLEGGMDREGCPKGTA